MPDSMIRQLALEHFSAWEQSTSLRPPSQRLAEFDFQQSYAVAAQLVEMRRQKGHLPIGRKIGFTNQALWAQVGLDTPIWAHIYDTTVHLALNNSHRLSLGNMLCPRIEPEIVFKLRATPPAGITDPKDILGFVDAMALGFEVVDSHYPDWKFKPVDAVVDFGVHAALVIGDFRTVDRKRIGGLAEQLTHMRVILSEGDNLVAEGAGKNVLGNPAAALGFLSDLIERQPQAEPLTSGEIITTGTLTEAPRIKAGEIWTVAVEGIDLPGLRVTLS